MKNINLDSVNKVISYCEEGNTIEMVIDLIKNHPDKNDIIDYLGGFSVCEQFEYVFTCNEFLDFITETDNFNEIEQAKALLKANGFFVDNLWHVNDVKGKFDCTDEQAQSILEQSLTNEATMEQIWFSIDEFGGLEKLTPIEDEDNFPNE